MLLISPWLAELFRLSMVFRLKRNGDDAMVFIRKATTVAEVIRIGQYTFSLVSMELLRSIKFSSMKGKYNFFYRL